MFFLLIIHIVILKHNDEEFLNDTFVIQFSASNL